MLWDGEDRTAVAGLAAPGLDALDAIVLLTENHGGRRGLLVEAVRVLGRERLRERPPLDIPGLVAGGLGPREEG